MSNDLLQKLRAAQTDEERSWIVTESLLESLPEDVASALWAVAIPHWFDGEILAALCPELADRADEIYRQLQELSCVEVFPERGHNVHELTRNQLLDRLWKDNPERFRALSGKASAYFKTNDESDPQIEWIYHLLVVDSDTGISEFQSMAQRWDSTFHITELSSLIIQLKQQFDTNRITVEINLIKAIINFWEGKIKFISNKINDALESYKKAEYFYREALTALKNQIESIRQENTNYEQIIKKTIGVTIGKNKIFNYLSSIIRVIIILQYLRRYVNERKLSVRLFVQLILFFLLKASALLDNIDLLKNRLNILESHTIFVTLYIANSQKALGDIDKHREQSTNALEEYESALAFYREINNHLGEANTLQAIGDVLQFLKRSKKALKKYEIALAIYREIGDLIGEANTLKAIGDVLQFLKRSTEALESYKAALAFYRKIGDRFGIAKTLKAIGDVLQFLQRSTEALESYEAALAFYREIGARLGEANTLQEIAILEDDPTIGLASSQAALNLYIEIGDKYSQARNLNYFTSKIQLKLGQKAEAISSLTLASQLAQEINYQPMVDYANQKIAEINRDSQGMWGWFNWIKSKLWKD